MAGATKGRDLKVSFLTDLDKFEPEPAADGLDALADAAEAAGAKVDDLNDAARGARLSELGDDAGDASRKVSELGDDVTAAKGDVDDLDDAARTAARKIDDSFDKIRSSSRSNLRDGLDEDTHHAKESLKEVGDEARGTGREMAASFTGSSDDIMGALQELGANAGAAFGPVGDALSLALGVGLGTFFADWQKKKEKLTEDVETFTQALIEGQGRLTEEFLNQQIAGLDPKELKELAAAAKDAGINVRDVIRAYAGDPEAIDRVNEKINAGAEALKATGVNGAEADPGLATYAAGVAKISDKLGITSQALGDSKTAFELMREAMAEPVVPTVDGSKARDEADNTREHVERVLGRRVNIPVGVDGAVLDRQLRLSWLKADAYFRKNPITIRTKAGSRPIRDVP